jgi:hypothetical protein
MDSKEPTARLIALYLPQFHPIPENDEWWGKGFTEWTNTARAKPLFKGHYQPHVPADLGFYDLRVSEVREAQAELAASYGIEGFCYYHYWFAGKQVLERPFHEVLKSGKPDFPFCLCWANETWTGIWHGAPNRILVEQTYPGEADHRAHFDTLREAFFDPRYIKVQGKPLFAIYKPMHLPDANRVADLWREMAVQAGLPGLHLVGMGGYDWNPLDYGFDASSSRRLPPREKWVSALHPIEWMKNLYSTSQGIPTTYRHVDVLDNLMPDEVKSHINYPTVLHAWDNTPRSGKNGLVIHESSPELFACCLRRAIDLGIGRPQDERVVFLKSWNEWAEGNHLEPDLKYGHKFLEIVRQEVFK